MEERKRLSTPKSDISRYLRMYVLPATAWSNLEVNPDAGVVRCSPAAFPGIVPGMYVVAVNRVLIANEGDLRVLLEAGKGKGILDLVFAENADAARRLFDDPRVIDSIPMFNAQMFQDDTFDIDSEAAGDDDIIEEDATEVPKTESPLASKLSHTFERYEGPAPEPMGVLLEAVARVPPGRCIVVLVQQLNPSLHIESAAKKASINLVRINASSRMRSRGKRDALLPVMRAGFETGGWILVEEGDKSMSILEVLVAVMKDVHESRSVHKDSRVFILCEPHPHFPPYLLIDCVTLRFSSLTHVLEETMHGSESQLKIMHGSLQGSQEPPMPQRKVRIAPTVDVVFLESSACFAQSTSKRFSAAANPEPAHGMRVVAQFESKDMMFVSLALVGARDSMRVALGTNTGAVTILGPDALPLLEFHAARSCLWDLKFPSELNFSIACQDGSASVMQYNMDSQQVMEERSEKFNKDVFAITYVDPLNRHSTAVAGGMDNCVCAMVPDCKSAQRIELPTSVLALCSLPDRTVFFGGGNGSTGVIDIEAGSVTQLLAKHDTKVPAVAPSPSGQLIATGSYDKTLRLWDLRAKTVVTHTLLLPGVVTGVALDHQTLAACSGTSLIVWDLRALEQCLDSRQNAWSGLTRGIQLMENDTKIVTASTDGVARYWTY